MPILQNRLKTHLDIDQLIRKRTEELHQKTERWDGKGYPLGLAGTDIPLPGRIMALVDVYDALVSERPYKPAFSLEAAASIIMENAGAQFDPNIANVFYETREKFFEASKAANFAFVV